MTDNAHNKQRIFKPKRMKRVLVLVALFLVCFSTFFAYDLVIRKPKNAQALGGLCIPCTVCSPLDALVTYFILDTIFQELLFGPLVEGSIERHVNEEQTFIVEDFFEDFWVEGLVDLTQRLSAFGMNQVYIVGTFFDAKNQLETRRLFFQLHAEAHKDYHPSQGFCAFGTNTRSLAATESNARANKLALNEKALQRNLGYARHSGATVEIQDRDDRWLHFITRYCDPRDNNWTAAGTGLDRACDHDGLSNGLATGATSANQDRVNRDIDYTQLVEIPRTLDISFLQGATATDDEQDILALSANLFAHHVPTRSLSRSDMAKAGAKNLYAQMRSVVAKRQVAQNSFNAIVSMKSASQDENNANVGQFMAAVVADMMPASANAQEIVDLIGENPSYYAQLEILGKKLYQNPDFYTNLYDKPANVARTQVAMKAIGLMIDRSLYESELRQEMIMSILLANQMQPHYRTLDRDLAKGKKK